LSPSYGEAVGSRSDRSVTHHGLQLKFRSDTYSLSVEPASKRRTSERYLTRSVPNHEKSPIQKTDDLRMLLAAECFGIDLKSFTDRDRAGPR
jgi:hypothetical protein